MFFKILDSYNILFRFFFIIAKPWKNIFGDKLYWIEHEPIIWKDLWKDVTIMYIKGEDENVNLTNKDYTNQV